MRTVFASLRALAARGALASAACALGACSSSSSTPTDADRKAAVERGMHDTIDGDLADLVTAAQALKDAAPTPAGRGWDATADAAAIAQMRDAWRRCRIAYEHVEGAIAPIFPDVDAAIDARYDDFLVQLGGKGDPDPFDDQGVTGMHAVERILYADQVPARTIAFEKTLPGYAPPAFPATEAQAIELKTKLLQRLVDDVTTLRAEWKSAAIDIGVAFQGLVALMNEQREKVNKAATGEEESRYAQMTMFDLRNNLDGTSKVYALFEPWLRTKSAHGEDGAACDDAITRGFQSLSALYARYPGDAVPEPPPTWSSDHPSDDDLRSPFGALWKGVHDSVDPNASGSVVHEMDNAADLLGFPQFVVAR